MQLRNGLNVPLGELRVDPYQCTAQILDLGTKGRIVL